MNLACISNHKYLLRTIVVSDLVVIRKCWVVVTRTSISQVGVIQGSL